MTELNKQLQELSAKVKNAQNSIVGHHQALSVIVDKLSSNPYTIDVGAVGKFFYDHMPGSFQVLVSLVGSGIPSFESLMDQAAEALVQTAEDTSEQIIQKIESAINQQIQQLEDMIQSITDQINAFQDQIAGLLTDIQGMIDGPAKDAKLQQLAATQKSLDSANAQLTSVTGQLSGLQGQAVDAVKTKMFNFILSQQRLALGKSESATFKVGP